MDNLDKYNPVSGDDVKKREIFDLMTDEEKKKEIERLQEGALIENSDSFYDLIKKEEDQKEKEDLELAVKISEIVREHGGLALVVGGFARDAALSKFGYNLKPKDIDIEVYGIEVERLQKILESLGKLNVVGAKFGVIKLGRLDISIPRRDSKTGVGHKGFVVEGDPNMLVRDAAKRRDFTINALALNPLTGEILDFYGGIEDIKTKTLRAVDGQLFKDDSLRVLRAAQFVARFGFSVSPETAEICRSLDLIDLPKERIGEEWFKLLMKSEKPSLGLKAMLELGILDKLHPELKALIGVPQSPEHHPEGDVWVHTCLVADAGVEVAKNSNLEGDDKLLLMLSAICHDLGKPATTEVADDGRVTAYKHEDVGLPLADKFLSDLGVSKDLIKKVLLLVQNHMFIHNNPEPSDSAIRRLSNRLHPVTIQELANLALADKNGSLVTNEKYDKAEDVLRRAERLSVKDSKPKPLIQGKDLLAVGFTPGPKVGETLKAIEELRLDGQISSEQQAKDYARVSLHKIELQNYGLPGLEGRIQQGLDPAGMLAVKETRQIIERILDKVGIDMEKIEVLTRELHVGAIWDKSYDLALAEKPEVKVWLLLADKCHEVNDRELTFEEYSKDANRIIEELKEAEKDPEYFFEVSRQNIVENARLKFTKKDGVPFSNEDAFLHMSIAGEKYGVCASGDIYRVGANRLDYSILEREGLVSVQKEERGEICIFFQKDGRDVVKIKNPGYAIVFGNEELALRLAKTAELFLSE